MSAERPSYAPDLAAIARVIVTAAYYVGPEMRAVYEPEIDRIMEACNRWWSPGMPVGAYAFPGDRAAAVEAWLRQPNGAWS